MIQAKRTAYNNDSRLCRISKASPVTGSIKRFSSLDISAVELVPVSISLVTDVCGGGGDTTPQLISPANAERVSVIDRIETKQK
jgi:hypothetical protein